MADVVHEIHHLDIEGRISRDGKLLSRRIGLPVRFAIKSNLASPAGHFHHLRSTGRELEDSGKNNAHCLACAVRQMNGMTDAFTVEIDIALQSQINLGQLSHVFLPNGYRQIRTTSSRIKTAPANIF